MATKRTMNITLKFQGGTTLDLEGDAAQRAYQEYMEHVNGGIRKAAKFTNADGRTEYVEFSCLCGVVVGETAESTVDDIPCAQVDCIKDYPNA